MEIEVAFSGSGFKLPALVGALNAIHDIGYKINAVAGTSGGSIVSALYATGMSPADMKDLMIRTDFTRLMPWKWWGWWNGLSDSDNLLKFMEDHTDKKLCKDTHISFQALATNLSLEQPFVFSTETTPEVSVAFASVCSASIPFIYQSRSYQGFLLADGGMTNNLPVSHLNKKANRVGIELFSTVTDTSHMSFMAYTGRLIDTMLTSNERTHIYLAKQEKATIVPVNTFGISMLDRKMSFDDRTKLYESGYNSVLDKMGRIN